jgi:hypothetical protein
MAWTYVQRTGEMFRPNETLAAIGYAGTGPGRNNPDMQDVRMTGPIPRGIYRIGAPENHKRTGPHSIRLTPDPTNEMYGRSAFLIHGDNKENDASNGCIILPRVTREEISASADKTLYVYSESKEESLIRIKS